MRRATINKERPLETIEDLEDLRHIGETLDFADPEELERLWEPMRDGFSERMDQAVRGLVEETREYRRHECTEEEIRIGCEYIATQQDRLAVLLGPLTRADLTPAGSVDRTANPITDLLWTMFDILCLPE
jgi:hypothetical protein